MFETGIRRKAVPVDQQMFRLDLQLVNGPVHGKERGFQDIDPDDLVEKIDMIRKENVIDGRNGRKWVVENFDSRLVWKEIEKLY